MNLFLEICHYALGSLFIGALATIAGVVLLFFLIKGFYRNATFTPISLIIGAVLTVFLGFQFIAMSGAIGLKWMCNDFRDYINSLIPMATQIIPIDVSEEYASELLDSALDEFPLIANYVSWGEFSGFDTTNIADGMAETLNDYLNGYILRRIGWSLLFVIIGAFIVIKTLDIRSSISRNTKTRFSAPLRKGPNVTPTSASRGRSGRSISGF